MRKEREVYIHRVYCMHLLYYFWLSPFVSVDMSYHLVPFPYPNNTFGHTDLLGGKLSNISFDEYVLVKYVTFLYIWGQQYNYIHIVLYYCFFKSVETKTKKYEFMLFFILSSTYLFLKHKKPKQHITTTTRGILFSSSVFFPTDSRMWVLPHETVHFKT